MGFFFLLIAPSVLLLRLDSKVSRGVVVRVTVFMVDVLAFNGCRSVFLDGYSAGLVTAATTSALFGLGVILSVFFFVVSWHSY